MMLTEKAHEMSKQAIKCACLLYILQEELDNFKCSYRLKKWKNELSKEVDTEIEHIYSAKNGLCNDGQHQYTEITNKLQEDLPRFKDEKERMAILTRLISIEADRLESLSDNICYRVHPKIKALLVKVYSELPFTEQIKKSVTSCIYCANRTMEFFLGTYKEQLDAIKEHLEENKEYDTTRILQ